MEPYLEPNTTPTSPNSSENEQRQRTPSQAIIDFNGNVHVVRASHVHRQCCGRQRLTFWTHTLALFIAILTGLVMMILRGQNSAEFGLWSGIFSLGIGGFVPSPKLDDNADATTPPVRAE